MTPSFGVAGSFGFPQLWVRDSEPGVVLVWPTVGSRPTILVQDPYGSLPQWRRGFLDLGNKTLHCGKCLVLTEKNGSQK